MKVFAVLLLVGAAAAVPSAEHIARHFNVYGAPIDTRSGEDAISELFSSGETEGWRSVYEKPLVVVVQQDQKPEMVGFLVKSGLSGLAHSQEMHFLHTLLESGPEKVGIMLSAAKYLSAPEMEMPISRIVMPKDFTLSEAARLTGDLNNALPFMLVTNKDSLKVAGLEKLNLMGDFLVTEHTIKVATDIPSPVRTLLAKSAVKYASYPAVETIPSYTKYAASPISAKYALDSGVLTRDAIYPSSHLAIESLAGSAKHLYPGLYAKYSPYSTIVL